MGGGCLTTPPPLPCSQNLGGPNSGPKDFLQRSTPTKGKKDPGMVICGRKQPKIVWSAIHIGYFQTKKTITFLICSGKFAALRAEKKGIFYRPEVCPLIKFLSFFPYLSFQKTHKTNTIFFEHKKRFPPPFQGCNQTAAQ